MMNGKIRLSRVALMVVAGLALIGVGLIVTWPKPSGCGMHADCDHSAGGTRPPTPAAVAAQTTCPVMGGAVNQSVFVEYRGEKVYFCCRGCDQAFLEDPERYVAKLPQFGSSLQGLETGTVHAGRRL